VVTDALDRARAPRSTCSPLRPCRGDRRGGDTTDVVAVGVTVVRADAPGAAWLLGAPA
jgi:hypothetical protein